MNEDDTFAALKKPTYNEMYELWVSVIRGTDKTVNEVAAFFNEHGWNYKDFLDEFLDRT